MAKMVILGGLKSQFKRRRKSFGHSHTWKQHRHLFLISYPILKSGAFGVWLKVKRTHPPPHPFVDVVFAGRYPVPSLPAHSFSPVKLLCLIVKAWIYQLVVRQLSNGFLSCRQLLRQTDSTKLLTQYEADIAHIATHKRGLSMFHAKSLLGLFCRGADISMCECKLNPI